MKNNIIFIINPVAGKGKGKMIASKIQQYFYKKNIHFQTYLTEKAGHATELTLRSISLQPRIIVACGGDGTVNEVARALVGTNIPLGIIPIGSGNGLAANLNIPKKLHHSLEVIIKGQKTKIDVGKINDNFFFSNVGFGIDADVVARYSQKKTRNFLGYASASIKALFHFQSKKFKIELDHCEKLDGDYYFLFCSNSNEAGYGISFSPKAKLNDGKLDFLAVKKLNFMQQLLFSIYVLAKCIEKMKQAQFLQVHSVKFQHNENQAIAQIDGETILFNKKTIEVSIIPGALNVIIPN